MTRAWLRSADAAARSRRPIAAFRPAPRAELRVRLVAAADDGSSLRSAGG